MLLERQKFLDTRDVDVARHAILSNFGANRFNIVGSSDGFAINGSRFKLGNVALLRAHSSAAIETVFPEADFFRQYFVVRGSSQVKIDRGEAIGLSRHRSIVVGPGRKVAVDTSTNLEHLILRIDQGAMKRKLGALLNTHIEHHLTFDRVVDLRDAETRNMRRAIALLLSDADRFGPDPSDIVRKEIEQSIILRFLLSHPHGYTARLLAPPPRPSSSQLRLVEDYVEANWDKPIDIETLVRISQVSARSIFRHFRKAHDCSPLDFVKRVRLRHARSMLDADEDAGSVMGVALACGFLSLGHFAQSYRMAFGELPSATLRRARRNGRASSDDR